MSNTLTYEEVSSMPNVKVGPRHQITIPHDVFTKLKLMVGDFLELNVKDENIILTPTKMIPRDQAWFWTKEWQQGMKEAEEDIKEGRLSEVFDDADDLITHLRKQK